MDIQIVGFCLKLHSSRSKATNQVDGWDLQTWSSISHTPVKSREMGLSARITDSTRRANALFDWQLAPINLYWRSQVLRPRIQCPTNLCKINCSKSHHYECKISVAWIVSSRLRAVIISSTNRQSSSTTQSAQFVEYSARSRTQCFETSNIANTSSHNQRRKRFDFKRDSTWLSLR